MAALGIGHIAAFRPDSKQAPVKAVQPEGMDAADRENFRGWFTFLAEAQFEKETKELPAEIGDCAALVRFAYREALRRHDGRWAEELRLTDVPALGPVRGYSKPAGGWFRVRDGEYADFADAKTLIRENTSLVGRDLDRAQPGDLLFFHQLEQNMPFHLMIYLGEHILYHTGPGGEIRRPSVEELLRHPNPQWRPVTGNSNFLGVYRWHIINEL